MAIYNMVFYSKSLHKNTTVYVMMPNDYRDSEANDNPNYLRNPKTLYLLHGFEGDASDWLAKGLVQELAMRLNMVIVLPSGDNSFYLDYKGTGRLYGTFVGKELPEYIQNTFSLSKKKEDNYIGGLSMGGFGAVRTAMKYPETFGKCFGLSSAMIIHDIEGMQPGSSDDIADYDYYVNVFGELDKLCESENNPEYLIKQLQKASKEIPDIYMACGKDDFLVEENRQFIDFLVENEVKYSYSESVGIHDWNFWNDNLESAIRWCLDIE